MNMRIFNVTFNSFDAARFNRIAAYPLSALAFFGVGFLFALAV